MTPATQEPVSGSAEIDAPLAPRGPVLEIEGLSVRFGADRQVRAVSDVDLEVARGEVVALVGESGSGKSALARAILGLHSPRRCTVTGLVSINGRNLVDMSPRELQALRGRYVTFVPQNPSTSLDPTIRIGSQIAEVLEAHEQLGRPGRRQRTHELLDVVGLPDPHRTAQLYPHQLSGGMRQRVVLAIAVACGPDLIVADEPTTALDVTVQARVIALLERLRTQLNTAVLIVSHNLALVSGFADRVAVMYAGRLVEVGRTETLIANPRHPYTDGLLRCIPSIDAPVGEKLAFIAGAPPDLGSRIVGCAFAPRCRNALDRCSVERPALSAEGGHAVACYAPVSPA